MIHCNFSRIWGVFVYAIGCFVANGLVTSTFGQEVAFHAPTIFASPGEAGFFDVYFEMTDGPVDVVGWDVALSIAPHVQPGISFTAAELAPDGLMFEHGSPVVAVDSSSLAANDFDSELLPVKVPTGRTNLVRINYVVDPAAPPQSTYGLVFGGDGLNNITTGELAALPDIEIDGAIHIVPEPSSVAFALSCLVLMVGCVSQRRLR